MTLAAWAAHWQIAPAAIHDLRAMLGMLDAPAVVADPSMSEAGVQARVRLAASRAGMRLWRNNVGAVHDAELGRHIRYGLANDSPQMNAVLKSADLIGIRPRIIGPSDIGELIGQFVSYEVKHAGWRWTGSDREQGQAAWAALITSLGGEARFVTDASHV